MGAGSGSQTIGYKYFMSLLMGLGRGPFSEIVAIKAGDKIAWRGPISGTDPTPFYIRAPELFGGDQKEGGLDGPAMVLWGGRNQTLPGPNGSLPGVKETISPGAPMPALRGVTCIWYDGEIASLNPYPKEWKVRARRHIHGWYNDLAWYPEKAVIELGGAEIVTYKRALTLSPELYAEWVALGGSPTNSVVMVISDNIKAMNGAHIIYECVTNPEWGRGESSGLIDENSFIYAADTLFNEGFGLCFFWQRQEDVDEFIKIVLDHIGGELYTDRSSGLLTLRLIRDDYEIEDLPTFEPGRGLLEILLDDSGSQDIAYNEVVIKWHSPIDDTDGEQRAQNVGARIAQGAPNSMSKDMPGLPTPELASRVALRELIVQSSGLKRYKVRLDRSGWRIAPGMPFRIKCPQRGIESIVLRAGEITDSSAQQGGDIQITALEDIFSMPATGMTTPQQKTWTPPVTDAVPPPVSIAFELTYYDMVKHLTQFEIPNINDNDSYLGMVAAQPTSTQLQYDLMVRTDPTAEWRNAGTFSFTAYATLRNAIGALDGVIEIDNPHHFPTDVISDSLMIGTERLRIDSYDPATGTMNVARGVVDTLPAAHAAGSIVWLPDDDISSDRVIYMIGETISAAAATRTNGEVLLPEDYDPKSLTIVGRVGRPYPVVNLKVNGVSAFSAAVSAPQGVETGSGYNAAPWSRNNISYDNTAKNITATDVGYSLVYRNAIPGKTLAVRLKKGSNLWAVLFADNPTFNGAWFNLDTGAVGTDVTQSATIQPVGDGFYLCSIVIPATASGNMGFGIANGDNTIDATPGKTLLVGDYYLGDGAKSPVLTWDTRNRVLQQDQLVGYAEGTVEPENGTTYEVVVKRLDGTVLRTEITSEPTFTYTLPMQAADGSPQAVLMSPRAVRNDTRQFFDYSIRVNLL